MSEFIGTDISVLLHSLVSQMEKQRNTIFYVGKVIDNNDTTGKNLGLCKIRVYGAHGAEIPDSDLPWAEPDSNFVGSSIGSFIVPPVGALVNVYFDNNNMYAPRYTSKVLTSNSLSLNRLDDYPDTMVFYETDEGEYFKINRKTLTSTYFHPSGTMISIDKFGNVEINNESAEQGNITITNNGNLTVNSNSDISINSNGDISLTSVGDLNLVSTTGKVNIEGLASVDLKSDVGAIRLGGDKATSPVCNIPITLTPGNPTFSPSMVAPSTSVLVSP